MSLEKSQALHQILFFVGLDRYSKLQKNPLIDTYNANRSFSPFLHDLLAILHGPWLGSEVASIDIVVNRSRVTMTNIVKTQHVPEVANLASTWFRNHSSTVSENISL